MRVPQKKTNNSEIHKIPKTAITPKIPQKITNFKKFQKFFFFLPIFFLILVFQSQTGYTKECVGVYTLMGSDTNLNVKAKELSQCKIIKGSLYITNTNFVNLKFLSQLKSITDNFSLSFNDKLTDLDGLEKLKSVGNLTISSNKSLSNLNDLRHLRSLKNLYIIRNNLDNLNGLSNLKQLNGYLYIVQEPKIENLNFLSKIKSITYLVYLYGNPKLKNIDGLKNVEIINFQNNFNYIYIFNNPELSDCACGLRKLFENNPPHYRYIDNNKPDGFCNRSDIPDQIDKLCPLREQIR